MKVVFSVFLALAFIALAAAETRPKISEDFQATGKATLKIGPQTHSGQGVWAQNYKAKMAREVFEFNGTSSSHLDYSILLRYDLHKAYTITTKPTNHCVADAVTGELPEAWSWVEKAKFTKKEKVNGIESDVWEYAVGGVKFILAVRTAHTNEPVAFSRTTSQENILISFDSWKSSAPASSFFTVPSFCPK
eukprot:TRINITY_DN496_c0_g1_i1.p1 TRINITY_DN496_c0_g1~~TRINITY_DN496_c0_g1_i1.p1  ORF type:complete len:200 (-),score=36.55 TRINITY_DN496_c0_g1_i1:18-590(-)